MRTRTTAPKARKRYDTRNTGDDVCPLVRVQFMGFWDGTKRVIGNRSRSLMVPEARVSEVYELVAAALAGLTQKGVDKLGSGC